MQRTQIYFPEELHQDLKIGAKMMKISVSGYIRKILEEKLYAKALKITAKKRGSPLEIAKVAIPFGKKDVAKNFDAYFEESLK